MSYPDLDRLVNFVLPLAQKQLTEDGMFDPFGVAILTSGELLTLNFKSGPELPDIEDVMESYCEFFSEKASKKEIVATALCSSCFITREEDGIFRKDAIAVDLENASGAAFVIYLPFSRSEEGEFQFDPIEEFDGEAKHFV